MLSRLLFALLALTATPLLAAPAKEVVREQRSFTVNGTKEVWRLIWRGVPNDSNGCGPANPEMAMTCPCSGAAYAQVGDLVLERKRPGVPPERMALTPLFGGSEMLFNEKGPVAILPGWPAPLRDIDRNPTPAAIRARPTVPIMRLRDYNHDGITGEFLLQIDTLPCGKHVLVAVGTTRDNPHLHALTSAGHPERPLALYQWQWEALARNPRPGQVMDWPCGDHAAEEETTMDLRTDRGRIHAIHITSTCPDTTDANGAWHHDGHFRKRVLKREVM
ncbi:hypothetical protein U1839_19630 [Sphingomonas sp. RT2P30]|uniref:hypothetical protein n=1 Tax=Parasphingomonas halimpatiens TaxID=3096162 RepID=UPI002FC6D333